MEHIKTGAAVTDDISHVVCLTASGAASQYMTFEMPVGVDYAVPAGHTLVIGKILSGSDAATNGTAIGYGDDGVAAGAAAPTNFKYAINKYFAAVANTEYSFDVMITIPAGKYPCLLHDSTAGNRQVNMFGVLIPT